MRLIVAALLTAITLPVAAQDLASMTLANDLGSVLASEKFCNLTYDQAAIAAFIEEKVDAADMSFASTLQLMVSGQEFQITQMSASSKTAHCAQISRVAKTYGFTE